MNTSAEKTSSLAVEEHCAKGSFETSLTNERNFNAAYETVNNVFAWYNILSIFAYPAIYMSLSSAYEILFP